MSEQDNLPRTRIKFSGKMIKFGKTKHYQHGAFITDISESGICIRTEIVFKKGTTIYMRFDLRGKRYDAEGEVIWSKSVPPGISTMKKSGMGVNFTKADKELQALYKTMAIRSIS
ncbi:MAG: PilZ domain-containing protein [Deltaproteobacteria bacterium]|nr:PilZ domain-containing protein [Deltaproteobacteria bacterium]